MDFEYGPEEKAFRAQVKEFLEVNHDPEVMDPTREGMAQLVDTPKRREFMAKLAERGWLGLSWPKEYGGGEAPGMYRVPAERGARYGRRAAHRQRCWDRREDDHAPRQ